MLMRRAVMNLREMEVIHAIIQAGSVTGAARLLNVSQPAVSTTLRHCEDKLKMKLFSRSSGKIYPTAEVLALYPDIAEIFVRIQTVNRIASELAGGRLGLLSVAAAFSIAHGPLSAALAEFRTMRPDVDITLQALPSAQVQERIGRKEVDVGFIFGKVTVPGVRLQHQRHAELCCVLHVDDPLTELEFITPADLASKSVISYAAHTHVAELITYAFHDSQVTLDRGIQINHPAMALTLVSAGAGVALIEPMIWSQMRYPDLRIRPFQPRLLVESSMITPVDVPVFKATEAFMEVAWRHIDAPHPP